MQRVEARFMRAALRLAARGLGRTSPNPAVGAVLVKRGAIIGRGYHARCGLPHAEAAAIAAASESPRGADLYVTLEPCGHRGRTPPCADAIIAAGIARVFYGCPDPNPATAGKGPDKCIDCVGMEANPLRSIDSMMDRVKQAAMIVTERPHALREAFAPRLPAPVGEPRVVVQAGLVDVREDGTHLAAQFRGGRVARRARQAGDDDGRLAHEAGFPPLHLGRELDRCDLA